MLEDQVLVFRLAIWCESHHFVLTGIDPETGVVGERGIQETNRVGKTDFTARFDPVAMANTPT